MKLPIIVAAGLLALGVAGCSSGTERGSAPPPPDPTVAPSEAESGSAIGAGAGTSAAVETIPSEPTGVPAAVIIPEAEGWANPGVPLSQHQNDIDACFSYASAQVSRDRQIDSDRAQGLDDNDSVTGLTTLSQRVDHYSEKRRRGSLFDSCMQAKGYKKS